MTPVGMGPAYCDRFDGALVYARGWSVLLDFAVGWKPWAGWEKRGNLRQTWRHPSFPGLLLWTPTPTTTSVLFRSKLTPEIDYARRFAEFALGPKAMPVSETVLPTAVRLVMRPMPGAQPPEPLRFARCCRIWPSHLVTLGKHTVELRVSATKAKTGTSYYAEAILGGPHMTFDQEPRALFFATDARKAPRITSVAAMKPFLTRVLFELVHFADGCAHIGLEVDPTGRQQLGVIADIGVCHRHDDVAFNVSIPMATMDLDFVA